MTSNFDYATVSRLLAEMRGCVERVQELRCNFANQDSQIKKAA